MAAQLKEPIRHDGRGPAPACDSADAAAYLDGELAAAESASFESHVKSCAPCASALAEQRRLLCLLDAAFQPAGGRKLDIAIPEDFARVMKARAQTDVRGLRCGSERRRAVAFVAALALVSLPLVGVGAVGEALTPLRALAGAAAAVLDMALHTAGEAFAGAALVLRGVGRRLVAGPDGGSALAVAALACAVLLLLRLISNYHRERLPD